MARKRMIDPGFWEDETLGVCSRDARLLFIGLISHADDEGRLRANPALVRAACFPYDDDVTTAYVDSLLDELHDARLIVRYTHDLQGYVWIPRFLRHQTINRATASTLPAPPAMIVELFAHDAVTSTVIVDERVSAHDTLTEHSVSTHSEEKEREEKRNNVRARARESRSTVQRAPDVIWDALVELFGTPTTDNERGKRNRAAKSLRDVNATPDEIRARAARYRREWPDVECTATALVSNWSRFAASTSQTSAHLPRTPEHVEARIAQARANGGTS